MKKYAWSFIPGGMFGGLSIACLFIPNSERGSKGLGIALFGLVLGWVVGLILATLFSEHPLHWNGEL